MPSRKNGFSSVSIGIIITIHLRQITQEERIAVHRLLVSAFALYICIFLRRLLTFLQSYLLTANDCRRVPSCVHFFGRSRRPYDSITSYLGQSYNDLSTSEHLVHNGYAPIVMTHKHEWQHIASSLIMSLYISHVHLLFYHLAHQGSNPGL